MPKLTNMLGETGHIEIDVPGDEPLVVEYRRGVMTPRLQMRLQSLQATDGGAATADGLRTMCDVFATLIASWNLTDDAGAVIPPDAEHLADVDLSILTAIMQRIGEAIGPDPLSVSGSSNGSSRTAGSGPRLITTAS